MSEARLSRRTLLLSGVAELFLSACGGNSKENNTNLELLSSFSQSSYTPTFIESTTIIGRTNKPLPLSQFLNAPLTADPFHKQLPSSGLGQSGYADHYYFSFINTDPDLLEAYGVVEQLTGRIFFDSIRSNKTHKLLLKQLGIEPALKGSFDPKTNPLIYLSHETQSIIGRKVLVVPSDEWTVDSLFPNSSEIDWNDNRDVAVVRHNGDVIRTEWAEKPF